MFSPLFGFSSFDVYFLFTGRESVPDERTDGQREGRDPYFSLL